MAICGSCGADVRRLVTKFQNDGSLKDECENCKPGGFHQDPAWLRQRPVMGWESKPKMYVKSESPDGGAHYEATDELRADTEAQICRPAQEEIDALEKKRKDRDRLRPLTSTEIARAHRLATEAVNAFKEAAVEAQKQEEETWAEATKPLRVQ